MFSLAFVLNDDFLIAYTLARTRRAHPDVERFQNATWTIDKEKYRSVASEDPQKVRSALEIAENRTFLDAVKALPYAYTLRAETATNLEESKTQWELNLGRSKPLVEKLVGHELKGDWNVYMIPPIVRGGKNAGNNTILWGHKELWPNYHTVYLWHELLHSFFPYNCSDLEHAAIELITDEELRTRLNGGSYPPFEGHPHLSSIKEGLLPAWRDYVKNPTGIYAFVKAQKSKVEATK